MNALLPAIEYETGPNPTHAVIWMHGLGADGNDFAGIVPELGLDAVPAVRFIFPHAPAIPVSCNGGYVMRAWYDILSISAISREVDEYGIVRSCEAVRALVARENTRGVPSAQIVLAGFSQGAAMAYTCGMTFPEKLAGIIALSGYIPSQRLIDESAADANRDTPIFAAHGSHDDVVPMKLGEQARDWLLARGARIEWHSYPMPHSVCLEEIEAIGEWLRARFAAAA